MTIEENNILTADEGKWLTKGGVYSRKVYLGTLDKAENWQEVSDEEHEEWLASQETATYGGQAE